MKYLWTRRFLIVAFPYCTLLQLPYSQLVSIRQTRANAKQASGSKQAANHHSTDKGQLKEAGLIPLYPQILRQHFNGASKSQWSTGQVN
ncbi:hypothetical protein DXT99_25140 [Pontibacter diazotrophicus]|uniref:Uncharacterized protein n=1 Tax=Pontibacter diazotrophicus TaxID=1400979 RepID=A0A3D8L1M0_9BACT|nr:hypothetical protein DXT99_25140 [Pontibacter diazotrophicus]